MLAQSLESVTSMVSGFKKFWVNQVLIRALFVVSLVVAWTIHYLGRLDWLCMWGQEGSPRTCWQEPGGISCSPYYLRIKTPLELGLGGWDTCDLRFLFWMQDPRRRSKMCTNILFNERWTHLHTTESQSGQNIQETNKNWNQWLISCISEQVV